MTSPKWTQRPIKEKNDVTITTLESQAERWREYVHEVLNRPAPEEQAQMPRPLHSHTREEIKKAIFSLNNRKVAEPDEIPAEVLKAVVETTAEMLFPLFEHTYFDKKKKSYQTVRKGTQQDTKQGGSE